MKKNHHGVLPGCVLAGWLLAGGIGLPAYGQGLEVRPDVQDLTKGGVPDKTHDWTLGPTGARGWIWGWKGLSSDARQILITEVAPTSPADGILQKGDVLLGVDGKPFDSDARIQYARAITEAEKETGLLNLIRWRAGQTDNVQLKLKVLGTYGDTAPYDSPKSDRILEMGCAAIAKEGFNNENGEVELSIQHDMNALALLGSGFPQYQPLVVAYAKKVAGDTPGHGLISWSYAYEALFLAEYELATKDPTVMPGLRRLALEIAHGASAVGTWGHDFARSDGVLDGYGNMNQPGIVLDLAISVAREAGVKDPDVDSTIEKASFFLHWYVNKGAIPYGDHNPWPWHDDNGKCSSATVLFDLLGDQAAATYFSHMATAAYNERESGHTGNFFSHLWAVPGVSRSGPQATGAYFKQQDWYYDLARCWDGRFIYQPTPGDWNEYSCYNQWDSTGAYLLTFELSKKLTVVTGRNPSTVPPVTAAEAAGLIADGRDFTYWTETNCYDGRTTEELFTGLASWSPAVRKRSAMSLGRREGDDLVPRLLTMLNGSNQNARYGACEALGCLGPKADSAAGQVRALLAGGDPLLRIQAADAIVHFGPAERKASVPDLLRAVVVNDPEDRRKRVDSALAEALFAPGPGVRGQTSILQASLDGVDRPLLYAAIREILKNQDGRIRGRLVPIYKLLTAQDVAVLLPDIVAAIQKTAPSGEMFAYDIRMSGLDLLARWHIQEGMGMCVDIMNEFHWGREFDRCSKPLVQYGSAAKAVLPRLTELQTTFNEDRDGDRGNSNKRKDREGLAKIMTEIETAQTAKPIYTIQEFMAHPPTKS